MQDGSLHCDLIRVRDDFPIESTRLEDRSGGELRLFAPFLGLMPDSAPPTLNGRAYGPPSVARLG
jgi:hypothetical protein